jgi:hypothetical protein
VVAVWFAPAPSPSPSLIDLTPSPTIDSTPVPTLPVPLPVEIVRDLVPDGWAQASFGSGVFFGVASLFVGIAAVVLARKANKAAVRAADEAEKATGEATKARAAVALERRRTFDLEILRDLLERFDDRQIARQVTENPAELRQLQARLSLLHDEDDLPFWKGAMRHSHEALFDLIGSATDEDRARLKPEHGGPYIPSRDAVERVQARLLGDVQDAINRRRDARDP